MLRGNVLVEVGRHVDPAHIEVTILYLHQKMLRDAHSCPRCDSEIYPPSTAQVSWHDHETLVCSECSHLEVLWMNQNFGNAMPGFDVQFVPE